MLWRARARPVRSDSLSGSKLRQRPGSPKRRELDRKRESDFVLNVVHPMAELANLVPEEVVSLPPEPFTLGSLRDGRLRVVEPIEVKPMLEEGRYLAEATELNEFGYGDNLSEALADLQAAIAELYLTLEEEQEQLGPDLASVWVVLSQKVRRADAVSCS